MLNEDLVGLKTLRNVQPFLYTWVIIETTMSNETAFHANWLVRFCQIVGLDFQTWFVGRSGGAIYD